MFTINLNNLKSLEVTPQNQKELKLEISQFKTHPVHLKVKDVKKELEKLNLTSGSLNTKRLKEMTEPCKYPEKVTLKAKDA